MKELLESHNKIIKMLQKGQYCVEEIAEETQYNQSTIRARIVEMIDYGIGVQSVKNSGENTRYYIPPVPMVKQVKEVNHSGTDHYRIALLSDTHLGAETEDLDSLYKFYEIAKEKGVREFYHSGDIVDGTGVYPGQISELKVFTGRKQIDYCVGHYPSLQGCKTYFITGNHDLKLLQREDIDIGPLIAKDRRDMIYLGQYEADVMFEKARLRLVHPDGGMPYAITYRLQKYVENIAGGTKPNIISMGHLHQSAYAELRNIHCFEYQTKVITSNGKKKIGEIQVGDYVLTHKNRYRKVIKKSKRSYDGEFVTINYCRNNDTHTQVVCTPEHPILVVRANKKEWIPAKEIKIGDRLVIISKNCQKCGKPIPWLRKCCAACIIKRKEEMQKNNSHIYVQRLAGGSKHYKNDILPRALEMEKQGYRVVPIGKIAPDIIAFKDNKIYAIEIEDSYISHGKKEKYDNFRFVDEVRWELINRTNPKWHTEDYEYDDETKFCYVDVTSVFKRYRKDKHKSTTVYNLEVEEDNTYTANGIVVHNCFMSGSFQRQNSFLRRKGVDPQISAWIIDFRLKNKFEINNLNIQRIRFY